MFGAVVKTWFAEKNGLAPEKIFSVALMPCTAKKVEVALPGMSSNPGVPDMDASLTTREFARMIAQSDIDVEALEDVPLDDPLDKGTGAGVIFGHDRWRDDRGAPHCSRDHDRARTPNPLASSSLLPPKAPGRKRCSTWQGRRSAARSCMGWRTLTS